MTETLQAPYVVDKAEDLDKLPVDSAVVIRESEFGDHVLWQMAGDIADHNSNPLAPEKIWLSTYYQGEYGSEDLLAMSYDEKALVVYVHPAK